jgi:tripartite-type tricarboxylate transporter receptor subunit TctC
MRTLLAALALAFPLAVQAQAWPQKPVKVVIPFPPGGVTDSIARITAEWLTQRLGQPFVPENRPGASGAIAADAVARAEADGYTLFSAATPQLAIVPHVQKINYDPVKDFAPISTVGAFGMVLAVDPSSPYKTLKDFIAAAKASPGRLNVGTTSPGGTQFIAADLFRSMAGIDFQIVPYKATPAIIQSVKGKDLQGMVEILAPMLPQIRSGNLRALAVTFDHRFPGLPDVPTIAEEGVAGYEASAWNALAAPAKTPRAIIERLNKEIRTAVAAPDLRQRLQDLGVDVSASTPEELRSHLVSEMAKWKVVIERAHIEKQ